MRPLDSTDASEEKMSVEKEFLKKVLTSPESMQEAVEKQVDTNLVLDPVNKKLFEIALWFFQKYSDILVEESLKAITDKSRMDDDLKKRVLLLYAEIQTDTYKDRPLSFLIDEMRHAFKKAQLKEMLISAVNDLESAKVDSAVKSLKSGIVKLELTGRGDIREGFLSESADDRYGRYLDIKNNPEKYKGIYIGWPTFDTVTNGVRGGQLMVIIGAVKEGKSTALLNIAYNAHIAGHNIMYVSVEMPREQIERRYDTRDSQLSYSAIRDGKLSDTEEAIYQKVIENQKKRSGKFYVIDAHDCSTSLLKSKLSTFPHKIDLVVLDYLTLVQPSIRGRDQWEAIGRTTEEVRAIARDLHVPIITAAQANREGIKESKYKYGIENVGLSHLISAHADTLLSLRLVDRDELEVSDVVEMTAATIAIRDDRACRFTIDACFDKMLMTERNVALIESASLTSTPPIPVGK